MITRFDHAVIAVGNLDEAIESYSALGFEVFPGGRHDHRGTHNALIRFSGVDYIELLGVYDAEKAIQSGLNGRTLAEFTRDRAGGLAGHCYATDDIEADAARTRESGLEMVGPFEMQRARPDGKALTWRLLVPEDIPWRRRWPFIIEWDAPDEERLAVEGVGEHRNGSSSVSGVSITVRDLEEAVDLYSTLFDSEPTGRDEIDSLAAAGASFDIHGFTIELLSPIDDGPIREALERDGEGPFEVRVVVADLESTTKFLTDADIETEEDDRIHGLRVSARDALGARVVFAETAGTRRR